MIFNQLITEEPKYQAKALIVATDTINSGGSCSGNYIPSRIWIVLKKKPRKHLLSKWTRAPGKHRFK